MKNVLSIVLLAAFSLLSVELFVRAGWSGLSVLRHPLALQLALDLCLACFFAGAWMRHDARKHGISALPFLIALPLFGSIATLAYVVRRNVAIRRDGSHGARAAGSVSATVLASDSV